MRVRQKLGEWVVQREAIYLGRKGSVAVWFVRVLCPYRCWDGVPAFVASSVP